MVLPSKVPFSPLSSQCASITIFKSAWKGPSPHGQCTQLWRWQIVCNTCMQRFLLSAATFHSTMILWIVSFLMLYVEPTLKIVLPSKKSLYSDNKLESSIDVIAISKIWKHYPLTDPLIHHHITSKNDWQFPPNAELWKMSVPRCDPRIFRLNFKLEVNFLWKH